MFESRSAELRGLCDMKIAYTSNEDFPMRFDRYMLLCFLITVTSIMSASQASDIVLLNTFSTGLQVPHAAAFDPFADSIWLHESFGENFVEASRDGVFTGSTLAQPGNLSDDSDITIIDEAINVNGVVVPAGTMLFGTGDDFDGPENDAHLYAMDPTTGGILSAIDLPDTLLGTMTRNNIVGVAHSSVSDSLFFTSYRSDGVMEFDPSTGDVLNEFTLSPPGSTPFDIFYGDIEFNEADGNLYAIGIEPIIRVVTPSGAFVKDYDLGPLGVVGQLSGLGIDADRSELWITSTNGNLYHLGIPEPSTLSIIGIGGLFVISKRWHHRDRILQE